MLKKVHIRAILGLLLCALTTMYMCSTTLRKMYGGIRCWINVCNLERHYNDHTCNGVSTQRSLPPKTFDMCHLHIVKPPCQPYREEFLKVTDDDYTIALFSAYFDDRDWKIKLVSDTNYDEDVNIQRYCQIWYDDYEDPYISKVELDADVCTVPNPRYSRRFAGIYSCSAAPNILQRPYAVSIVRASSGCTSEYYATLAVYAPVGPKKKFVVCTPPLYGDINLLKLVEFIEMNRLFGAEKFYFYNESIPKYAHPLLQSYMKDGIVQVIQWHSLFPDIEYHNQRVMQFDCMFRNMYQAEYVAQIDIDEVIVPRQANNWYDTLKAVETSKTSAFMFLNRFYTTESSFECSQKLSSSFLGSSVDTLSRQHYYTEFFGPTKRSKIIYRPERVLEVAVHYSRPWYGYDDAFVLDHSLAILQHYRPIYYSYLLAGFDEDFDNYTCIFENELLRNMLERHNVMLERHNVTFERLSVTVK